MLRAGVPAGQEPDHVLEFGSVRRGEGEFREVGRAGRAGRRPDRSRSGAAEDCIAEGGYVKEEPVFWGA